MHNKKAGTTIDLGNDPTSLEHGLRDIRSDQVYAGDIETDHLRCLFGNRHIVRMDFIGAVDRDAPGTNVAGAHEWHTLAGWRNIFGTETLLLRQRYRGIVEGDTGLVLYAARGVSIAQLYQLAESVHAIPCDVSR